MAKFRPLSIFLIFLLGALLITYPLLQHLTSHIPRGDEPVGTVPLLNLWILQWNIDQLILGYPNYWDAPIFAPLSGTFAFSETQILTALLAVPFWFFSPALGYNLIIILFLTLNGWFTYWLLKSWQLSSLASLLAGLLMQALPFIAQEMGVLQLIAIFGLLWSLLFMSRFLRQSQSSQARWSTVIALALGLPVTFLTCGYYGLTMIFVLPLAFLVQLRREHLQRRIIGQLLFTLLLALALSTPFLLAQKQRLDQYHFTRSAKTVENNSAKLKYYLNFLDHNLFYSRFLGWESGQGQRLFPGVTLILLAGLALGGRNQRHIKIYLLMTLILALLLSLGLRLRLGEVQPYHWVRDIIPGFHQLRSPFRFAVLLQICLVLLAGFGLHNLRLWFPGYNKALLMLLTTLALFEMIALPLPLQPLPHLQTQAGWQSWLNQKETAPTIIMLPFAASNKVADFEQTTHWMLESRYFQGRMLNGYSGFFPPDHAHLREQILQFPSTDSLDFLRKMQVDYVVIHAPASRTIETPLPLMYQDDKAKVLIYGLRP